MTPLSRYSSFIAAASWLVSPHVSPLSGGAILVQDGVIKASGLLEELKRDHQVPVIEYPDCAILPGFVNAHTHLELTHFPAWRLRTNVNYNPRRFVDWMIQLIKIRRGIGAEEIPSSITEGIRLCLESGTTAIGEIVNNPAHAQLYRSSLLSGRLFFEIIGQDQHHFNRMLAAALEACSTASDRQLHSGLSPHTPYTIAETFLPRISAVSDNLPLAIHISESAAETDFIFNSNGPLAEELFPFLDWKRHLTPPRRCSSTELLDRAGLLKPSTLAVHCVHLTLGDAEILKQRGVSVVLCPRSNERLDVGRAPVALLRKLGIPLALGTDSLASNDTLSLWDEMRFALNTFSRELSPADVLHMATIGGAEALGIGATHGSLEPGKRADFQVVKIGGEGTRDVLERVLFHGMLEDVYLAGDRYAAATFQDSFFRRRQIDASVVPSPNLQ
ncbi:amidohydrolase family protein [Pelotalea chapellei]|uniref:Amidohydrolase family protein n=1 Tax=Pelotalea chapellei TaxID=44671 RepID=A0ABS5U8H1_9BACT|nr:amidohydrolase family protein [Pelotalea chapellei]MBT1071977.1 amidohydrolase family protein [Pelotalea chapellei]